METRSQSTAITTVVTTEPQRQALNAMSRDLTDKLNAMIAEQEARVLQFTSIQHSASIVPAAPLHGQECSPVSATTQVIPPPLITHSPANTPPPSTTGQHPRRRSIMPEQENKSEGLSGTSIAVIIIAIIVLLKACS